MLSRKHIENWPIWIVINAISVYVYATQGLWLYTALYAFFFFNAFWGWWEWRKEMRGYSDATSPA
jgi:nicotinamide mononucleotide transporter